MMHYSAKETYLVVHYIAKETYLVVHYIAKETYSILQHDGTEQGRVCMYVCMYVYVQKTMWSSPSVS